MKHIVGPCVAAILLIASPTTANADPTVGADPSGNRFFSEYKKAPPPTIGIRANTQPSSSRGGGESAVRYVLRNPCGVSINAGSPVCPQNTCQQDAEIYRVVAISDAGEIPGGLTCVGPQLAQAAAAPPQVTDAMVLAAFRRIPVPELRSISQPGDKTLVNFDTIFHADADGFSRTVTLLGRSVRLEIEPSSFRWEHGDGTVSTTSTPGAAYPRKDVVHRYADAHVTVRHRVVVTWSAQWSLDGGPLRPVVGTVTTTGPSTPLRVAEAVPALSGRR